MTTETITDQYTIHKMPNDLAKRGEQVTIGPKTQATLPSAIGYTGEKFASDVMAAFKDCEVADPEDVSRTWKYHALYKNDHSSARFVTMDEAEKGAVATSDFFKHFKESRLRDILLNDFCGGNVDKATKMFMDWAEYHFVPGQELPDAMGKLGKAIDQAGEGIDSIPRGKSGDGDKSKPPLTPQQMRIAEILPKVRRNYEFVGIVNNKYEESFYPEDDVERRTIQSYNELSRVPTGEFLQEDEVFFSKLIHRTLPVAQYMKAIPMPANFTVLLDVSGSMGEMLKAADGENPYFRYEYATAVCIAVCEQAMQSGINTVSVIYFDGTAHEPVTGDPASIVKKLWECMFSGGSTNFEAAFRAADLTDNAAVILITDCGGSYQKAPKAPLHVLKCGRDGDNGSQALRKIAVRFTEVV